MKFLTRYKDKEACCESPNQKGRNSVWSPSVSLSRFYPSTRARAKKVIGLVNKSSSLWSFLGSLSKSVCKLESSCDLQGQGPRHGSLASPVD